MKNTIKSYKLINDIIDIEPLWSIYGSGLKIKVVSNHVTRSFVSHLCPTLTRSFVSHLCPTLTYTGKKNGYKNLIDSQNHYSMVIKHCCCGKPQHRLNETK